VLALVADGVQQLAVGAQESSAVGLDLTMFLAETELNSEPVDLEMAKNRILISNQILTERIIKNFQDHDILGLTKVNGSKKLGSSR